MYRRATSNFQAITSMIPRLAGRPAASEQSRARVTRAVGAAPASDNNGSRRLQHFRFSLISALGAGLACAALDRHAIADPQPAARPGLAAPERRLLPGLPRWQAAPGSVEVREVRADEAFRIADRGFVAQQQADTRAQAQLARLIQTELLRVGCFDGMADGQWSEGSQRAMRSFNEAIHVNLPVKAPDYILLTMLQGHARRACGGEPTASTPGASTANVRSAAPQASLVAAAEPRTAPAVSPLAASRGPAPSKQARLPARRVQSGSAPAQPNMLLNLRWSAP